MCALAIAAILATVLPDARCSMSAFLYAESMLPTRRQELSARSPAGLLKPKPAVRLVVARSDMNLDVNAMTDGV
jgi:hypothetical protein